MAKLSKEERRQQIIEEAAAVFASRGLSGTRIREIAEACDVNEALLYRHFSSKEELFHEVMWYTHKRYLSNWIEDASNQPDGLSKLIVYFRSVIKDIQSDKVFAANLWHKIASAPGDIKQRISVQKDMNSYQHLLISIIDEGITDGSILEQESMDILAWLIRGFIWVVVLRTVLDLEVSDKALNPDEYCRIIIENIATDPAKYLSSLNISE